MALEKVDEQLIADAPHRLPGTSEQQEGGLIIKRKVQAASSDDQHIFKVPQIPPSTPSSMLGLDKLAAEKRRLQSTSSLSKRSKNSSSFDDMDTDDVDDNVDRYESRTKIKERQLRNKRVETPSSTRSSHHDYYDRSRTAAKFRQRGLVYGKDGNERRT
jgi:hypothetical protein